MDAVIVPALFGALISALGILNIRGNLSSIHWYHRQRVAEEDKGAFGKAVGSGTLIIGLSLILFAALSYAAAVTRNEALAQLGSVIVLAAIVLGLAVSLWAMFKYNKGIF